MKKIPITVVLLALVLCVSTALAFELGFNFGFGGRAGQKLVNIVPILGQWSSLSMAFGNQTTGRDKILSNSFKNTAINPLAYGEDIRVTVTGAAFRVYTSKTFGNLSAGRRWPVRVTFRPTAQQNYSGHLTYSAPNIPAVSAALSGTGVSGGVQPDTVKDSYTTTGGTNVGIGVSTGDVYQAGKFVASSGYTATSFDINLFRSGTVTGKACAQLRNDSSGTPGTVLATSATCYTSSDVTTSAAYKNYTINNTDIVSGSTYWLVVYNDTGYNASAYFRWASGANTGFTNKKSGDGVAFANANFNTQPNFKIYGH